MKWVFVVSIVVLLLLTACDPSQGNFAHLQNQDIAKAHNWEDDTFNQGYGNSDDNSSDASSSEEYCEIYPLCCGVYSHEQQNYYDLEQRALTENNVRFCYDLPVTDFIITCPSQDDTNSNDTLLYSQTRCLAYFGIEG